MAKRGKQCPPEMLNKVERLLYQKSYQAWKKLPRRFRFWIDFEDFYQEALLEVIRKYHLYDETYAWTTFVWMVASHRLQNLVQYYYADKRNKGLDVPLEVIQWEKSETQWPNWDNVDVVLLEIQSLCPLR